MENKRFIRRQARANQRKLDITLRQLTNGLLTAEQRYAIIHRLNIKKQYRLRLCVKPIRISDLAAVIDQSGTLQILLGDPLAACVHEATAFLVKCSTTTDGVDTLPSLSGRGERGQLHDRHIHTAGKGAGRPR